MTDQVKQDSQEMSQEEDRELSLEENFKKLEETIARLEKEDISLEDAFLAYSEGMQLLKNCNAQIDRVEKKVMKIAADGGLEEL
ncbi:MAG: exodeoxyribonuclease VII small subunit [Lachnospiraceae bacterium]|nr:exodeoxyribonuclease VII small subunit [Lachnospiraceae bacterium]